jgi:hypothetical protein
MVRLSLSPGLMAPILGSDCLVEVKDETDLHAIAMARVMAPPKR